MDAAGADQLAKLTPQQKDELMYRIGTFINVIFIVMIIL